MHSVFTNTSGTAGFVAVSPKTRKFKRDTSVKMLVNFHTQGEAEEAAPEIRNSFQLRIVKFYDERAECMRIEAGAVFTLKGQDYLLLSGEKKARKISEVTYVLPDVFESWVLAWHVANNVRDKHL